ncbi:rRNA-processing protein EBP2-like [Miscanthus floridulus]|uniref:rRNA-processing protein EBP2-like n=1 Tax=Miscanthus floridulus TaxID=154761 RepID=UPI00345A1FE6
MIKRRYFRQDHGGNSGSSSSSSSSGCDSDRDSAEDAVSSEEVEEVQEEEAVREESGEEKEEELEQQIEEESSGYQSEDNSGNDVDDASIDDDEHSSPRIQERREISLPIKKSSSADADSAKSADNTDDTVDADFPNCILKCKSVFKCKLCPRLICLNEEMVKIHLKSKRHARSEKLLGEGRLKLMLNSDGELEEEQETHAERHARTIALSQQVQKPKKDSGRQRQNRRKKRSRNNLEKKQEAQNSNKKQRKAK